MDHKEHEKKFPIWEMLTAVATIIGVMSSFFFYFDGKQSTEAKIVEGLSERYDYVDREMSYEHALEMVDKELEISKNRIDELQKENDLLRAENEQLQSDNSEFLGVNKGEDQGLSIPQNDLSLIESLPLTDEQLPIEESNSTEYINIAIDPNVQVHDNYYYEYPDPINPSNNFIVDFGKGISGTYTYSRILTEEERKNWEHGGKLYDSNGNEIGEEGNWPTFWSNTDGKFAVEFPQNLPPGHYTYEIYHIISGQFVSDRITFENI